MLKLIDVYAPWCGSCSQSEPHLERFSKETGIPVTKINADEDESDFIEEHQVRSLPALFLFDDDKLLWRFSGPFNYEDLTKGTKDFIPKTLKEKQDETGDNVL